MSHILTWFSIGASIVIAAPIILAYAISIYGLVSAIAKPVIALLKQKGF